MVVETVTPIVGEPLRFHVRSRTEPGLKYLVDLESYNRNGECGCQHFEFRLRPVLAEHRHPTPSDRTRCWHILKARGWLLDRMLEKLSEHLATVGAPIQGVRRLPFADNRAKSEKLL